MLLHTIDMITRSHDILATNIHKYAALSHSAYICMLFDDETIEYWLVLNCVTRAWLWTEGRLKFDKQHISPLFTWCLPIDPFPIPFLHLGRVWRGVFTIFTLAAVAEPESQPTGKFWHRQKWKSILSSIFGVFFSGKVRPCFSRAYIGLKNSSAVPG